MAVVMMVRNMKSICDLVDDSWHDCQFFGREVGVSGWSS